MTPAGSSIGAREDTASPAVSAEDVELIERLTDVPEMLAVAPASGLGLGLLGEQHPAAILLVDLITRRVTYANALARQLAPDVTLPADVDEWSRSAGLWNEDGDALDASSTPLHRVATGTPVHGEQVTAHRRSDVSAAREDLWVIGTPLRDAPDPLRSMALVVFLPVRDREGVRNAQKTADLQQRAVASAQVSFSISDPHAEDNPLVWVNPAFEHVTGYRRSDVLGTNCRFLQGPGTDPAAIERIRAGLRDGGYVTEVLLNYRADGSAFWNHIVISPIFGPDGELTHHVGVQSDITARVEADAERLEALRTSEAALAEAKAANDRLAVLAAISQDLAITFDDGAQAMDALPAIITNHLDGWALAAAVGPDGRLTSLSAAHSGNSPVDQDAIGRAQDWLMGAGRVRLTTALTLLDGQAPLRVTVTAEQLGRAGLAALLDPTPGAAALDVIVTALTARGAVIGLLALARDPRDGFADNESALVTDLGLRAGVAIDNARLYAREHAAALTLQRSLLPRRLPTVDGFDIAAVYRPAAGRAEVGGDWYDVLNLPDTGIGVAVGDVMGHDLGAAAAMGQLRSILRSYAWAGGTPSTVLNRLHELVLALDMAALATCAYGVIAHDDEADTCTVTYALAGHPPPMIKHPDGSVESLRGGLRPPIGVAPGRDDLNDEAALPHGAYLVLYTDGLIERRDADIDEGLETLRDLLAAADPGLSAAELCDTIVERLVPDDHEDDTCVLIIRHLPA